MVSYWLKKVAAQLELEIDAVNDGQLAHAEQITIVLGAIVRSIRAAVRP